MNQRSGMTLSRCDATEGFRMMLKQIGLVGVITAMLAVPALAQTTQTTPQTPQASLPGSMKTAPGTAAHTQAPVGPVNINTASAAELDKLPGIGKARADAIIKNRPYKSPDELASRHIIPQKVYDKIKNDVVTHPG
jgi:DNA uptake protein ComE-like DNA-binding protein